jgi:transcriptional regulator with XRE-family HTH domain
VPLTFRELRESVGLTQYELAIKVEATPGAVYKWEHGGSEPRTRYLVPLARALGVSTDEMIHVILATKKDER